MRKLLPFLACLMLVMATWAGMAHAAEARGVETGQMDMAAHVAGDGDEVPADADKGYPHHHAGCHEHHLSTPPLRVAAVPVRSANATPSAASIHALGTHEPDAALRPPQA